MTEMVSESEFEEKVLKSQEPVFVDFFATWCGPCKMMAPIVDEMAVELEGKAKVYKLDVDEAPGIARAYRVFSVPTFMVFKNGELYKQTVGGQDKEGLMALFD